jgi:hypothetical protein
MTKAEHDKDVIQMNEVRRRASGWVQRMPPKVDCMISEPGHPTGNPRSLEKETTMLKTISAALLAVSVIAAPALAETAGKTTQAPVNKTAQDPASKTTQAPVIKADQTKSKALNANAKMGRHHNKHMSRHHYKHTKKMGALKTHAAPVAKRG